MQIAHTFSVFLFLCVCVSFIARVDAVVNDVSVNAAAADVDDYDVQGGAKTGPLCVTAFNFRSIGQIGTKFGTNHRYFTLNITS